MNIRKRLLFAFYARLPLSIRYHQSHKKNILLFSSRRGGSTIMAQLLHTKQHNRIIDQPFDLFDFRTDQAALLRRKLLPPKFQSQFTSVSPTEASMVERYVRDILSGKYIELGMYHWAYRTVLKIVNALPLVDWLYDRFPVQVVYLTRHPIAQAQSIVRNKWGITAAAYLNDPIFAEQYITPTQQALAHKLINQGSFWEQAILNWCLENIFPLKFSKSPKLHLTYEELVSVPHLLIPKIYTELALVNPQLGIELLSKPSGSKMFSTTNTNQAIISQNKDHLLSSWEKNLSETERQQAQDILDAFEINLYHTKQTMPKTDYLHFKP